MFLQYDRRHEFKSSATILTNVHKIHPGVQLPSASLALELLQLDVLKVVRLSLVNPGKTFFFISHLFLES